MKGFKYTAVFLTGAAIYGSIEILSRGWTHWSMLLAGGICITIMYLLTNGTKLPLWKKWIACSMVITSVEFISGVVFNLCLQWHIWDYSDRAYNILGQICPTYSLLWLCISVPGVWLCRKLHQIFT